MVRNSNSRKNRPHRSSSSWAGNRVCERSKERASARVFERASGQWYQTSNLCFQASSQVCQTSKRCLKHYNQFSGIKVKLSGIKLTCSEFNLMFGITTTRVGQHSHMFGLQKQVLEYTRKVVWRQHQRFRITKLGVRMTP